MNYSLEYEIDLVRRFATYMDEFKVLILSVYGFNTIESSTNQYERLLMYVLVVYSCYSAANLSSMVRDRQEATLMQRFGANSRLYSASTIATLMGNTPKFYLN